MNRLDDLINQLEVAQEEAKQLENSENIEEIKACVDKIKTIKAKIELEKSKKAPKPVNSKETLEDLKADGGLYLEDENGNVIKALTKGMSLAEEVISNSTDTKVLNLGKYVKGMVTGNWVGAEEERQVFMSLNTSTGTTLIPTELSAKVIDLARPKMSLEGVPIIPMTTNNLTIAKIVSDPQFGFKKELEETTESEMTFAPVNLKSKTIYGLMKVSLELFESASNIEQVITQAMANSIAQSIDNAGLYGKGDKEPLGITKVEGINVIENIEPIETSKYIPYVRGIRHITKANGTPNTITYNSDIDTEFNLLTDTTGQPLNAPQVINLMDKKLSNNVKDKQALIFDRNNIVMGLQNKISIETSRELGFKDGSVYLRIYGMLDFAVLNPKAITKLNYKGFAEE